MSFVAVCTYLPSLILEMVLQWITSRRWYDRIDDVVILGALPFANQTDKLLNEENVKAVISMNKDFELWLANGKKEWEDVEVEFLQLPVVDMFEAPDQSKLEQGIQFINKFVPKSSETQLQPCPSVYVHCKVGKTRSATLVGCYLMARYGWDPEKAVNYMKTKRSQIWLQWKQWEALRIFYENLTSKRNIHTF